MIKNEKKSLQQRLGKPNVKARLNLPIVGGQLVRGRGNRRAAWGVRGGFFRGSSSFIPRGARKRGQVTKQISTELPSQSGDGYIRRGRGGARGRSWERGMFRGDGFSGSYRGGRGRAGQTARGVGRGRAFGGRRGRGSGRGRGVSREELDNQLDEYMSKTRGQLDSELSTYMQQSTD